MQAIELELIDTDYRAVKACDSVDVENDVKLSTKQTTRFRNH